MLRVWASLSSITRCALAKLCCALPRIACLKVVAALCIIQGSDRRLLRLFYYGILPPPFSPHSAHHLHLPHFTHDQACLGLHATFSCGFHCILQGCARRLIYMPNGACNTLPFSPLFFCFFLCCCHVFNYPTATAPAAAAAFVAHNLD